MKIEKIDRKKECDLCELISTILDKVDELVDAHNHMEDEKKNISICIDGKSMSTLVSDINGVKATVTTLKPNEIKVDCFSKDMIDIDNKLLKKAAITTTNKGEI